MTRLLVTGQRWFVELNITRYQNDDDGYLAWIDEHPTGFVVNCAPNPSIDYLVLHRASCMHITLAGDNMEHWTHQYIKVCAPRNGMLVRWCEDVVGGPPSLCSTCTPLAPGGNGS